MTTINVECPSGLTLIVRGLTLAEEDMLGSARAARRVDAMDQVLGKCWQETISPGPCYDFSGRPDWDQVLQGDREATLYAIRQAMYGPEYEFRVQCDIPSCRHVFTHMVNLDELPVHRLSEEDAERFRNGNRFEVEIEDFLYVYVLATGQHLKDFERKRQKRPQHQRLLALSSRIVEIHSLPDDRALGKADMMTHLATREIPTIEDLRDEFVMHDCGIDTSIEDVECPDCFAVQDIDLPFDVDFFSPRTRKRAARRRQRTSATSSGKSTSRGRSGTGSGSSATFRSSAADSD